MIYDLKNTINIVHMMLFKNMKAAIYIYDLRFEEYNKYSPHDAV